MERRVSTVAGLRPLALHGLPADFFEAPCDPAQPEPLAISWPRRGGAFRLTGDAGLQAQFRAALAAYEAAEVAAVLARLSGDVRGFFQHMTETHRHFAALRAFGLAAADLSRLQASARRHALRAAG